MTGDEQWRLVDLVAFGLERASEADRLGKPHIVVTELYRGSVRISSQIQEHPSVVKIVVDSARRTRSGFAVLKRAADGWLLSDFDNCIGDRAELEAAIPKIIQALRGDSSTRAPGYPPGDAVSNPHPAPLSTIEVRQ